MADEESQLEEKRRPARRRRTDFGVSSAGGKNRVGIRKLGLDEGQLDPNMSYRWVKDTEGKVSRMFNEDWDPVRDPNHALAPKSANKNAEGVARHGGVQEGGQEFGMVLMQKPLDLFNEDRDRTHYSKVRERRNSMQRQGPRTVDENYVPDGAKMAITKA